MTYYRSRRTSYAASVSNTATERQIGYARSLFTELQALLVEHAGTPEAEASATIVQASAASIAATMAPDGIPTKGQASDTITALKSAKQPFAAIAAAEQASKTPGIPSTAERIISNRFDPKGGCFVCGESVPQGTGFAAVTRGTWRTYCADCAATDPAELEAKRAREAAERAVEAKAEQAKADARRRLQQDLKVALKAVKARLVALTGSDTKGHRIRVAIPGGVLDVDQSEAAYALCWSTWVVSRHTGAPGSIRIIPLGPESGIIVAEYLLSLDDEAFLDAQALYGRHFHACGRCGSPLSDDASKARGLGPDCATKGF